MARLESVAVGGYYPMPNRLIPAVVSLIDASGVWKGTYNPTYRQNEFGCYAVLDPCAGDGDALLRFSEEVFGSPLPSSFDQPKLRLYACELEGARARALEQRLRAVQLGAGGVIVRNSDAFQLSWEAEGLDGVSLLWLNPPYEHDRRHGRLEQAFLSRFTPALARGYGVLAFVVPGHALSASADYLAAEYEDITCFRFPEPEYDVFKQVVLLARRRETPLAPGVAVSVEAEVRAWASDPDALPRLPQPGSLRPIYRLPSGAQGGLLSLVANVVDVETLRAYHMPLTFGASDGSASPTAPPRAGEIATAGKSRLATLPGTGLAGGLVDFLNHVTQVAMPPKPAWVARLIASGMLDGLLVEPDELTSGMVPLLLKGRFSKELRIVKENTDKKGKLTSTIEVQQPKLSVTILAMTNPPAYHTLVDGTHPTGETDYSKMNLADLLVHYGRNLAALQKRQFPARHDPTKIADLLPLPPLGRPLYDAQAHVVMSTLKALSADGKHIVLGEVGTGKSAISLAVAEALSPSNYNATRSALRGLGLWTQNSPLHGVGNVLVLCPPHLKSSWVDQVKLALPSARTVVVEAVSDLHRVPAPTAAGPGAGTTVYIMSRERAKLGSRTVSGVSHSCCPKCGAPVYEAPEKIASAHLSCRSTRKTASNQAGTVALALAEALLYVYPDDELLGSLVQTRMTRVAAARGVKLPQDGRWAERVEGIASLAEKLGERARQASETLTGFDEKTLTGLLRALTLLHLALPSKLREATIDRTIRRLAPAVDGPGAPSLRETLWKLVLLAAKGVEAGLRARLLTFPHYTDHNAASILSATRERLVREQDAAEAFAIDPTYRPTQGGFNPRFDPSWSEFGVPLETGALTLSGKGYAVAVGDKRAAYVALQAMLPKAEFEESAICGEPLYQLISSPKRYPLARYIARRWKKGGKGASLFFDMIVLDEIHEFNNVGSAQQQAAHLLAGLPGALVLGLTGSLMGGKASALFANFRAFCPSFRRAYGPNDKSRFVSEYGYLKVMRSAPKVRDGDEVSVVYGAQSLKIDDEKVTVIGEAPGVMPSFLPHYLLVSASPIHKADLGIALPALSEKPVGVLPAEDPNDEVLAANFARLQATLVAQIKADAFTKRQGRLWGAMTQLLSYPDLATADVGNALDSGRRPVYEIRYSENAPDCGGQLVASAELLPVSYRTPKERWLLSELREQLSRGRNVLLFCEHTGSGRLVGRYTKMLLSDLGVRAVFLDCEKVDTSIREEWINAEVIRKGVRVLIVNPRGVKTGLNCLTPHFKTAVWMESSNDALTYRQANGRIHRLGSDPAHPIEVLVPVYADTSQELALNYLAEKVTVSEQMDGLNVESQLEAAGASGDDDLANAALMSVGESIYRMLVGDLDAGPRIVSLYTPASPTVVTKPDPALTDRGCPFAGDAETARDGKLYRQPNLLETVVAALPPIAAVSERDGSKYQQLSLFD